MTTATVSILSWNIYAYRASSVSQVAAFIAAQDADLVCLQEDVTGTNYGLADYVVAAQCEGELFLGRKRICNTVLVKKSLKHLVTGSRGVKLNHKAKVERCAAVIQFADTIIANVHLCGGRNDDLEYAALAREKEMEIAKLVYSVKPDIVVGDLNSESTRAEALETLQTYPLFTELSDALRDSFLQYYLSGHHWLRKHRYKPAFLADDVRPTSVYGGVPDWVYLARQLQDNVESVEKLIGVPHLSDHNALLVRIKL